MGIPPYFRGYRLSLIIPNMAAEINEDRDKYPPGSEVLGRIAVGKTGGKDHDPSSYKTSFS